MYSKDEPLLMLFSAFPAEKPHKNQERSQQDRLVLRQSCMIRYVCAVMLMLQ
jgi:hypothetical protein